MHPRSTLRGDSARRRLFEAAALSCALGCTGAIFDPEAPPPAPVTPVPTTAAACATVPSPAGAVVLPRLTRDEVRRSLIDALALPEGSLDAATPAVPADTRAPSRTSSRAQTTTFDHVLAFAGLAESAADAADLAPFLACTEFRPGCTEPFVAALGERLFRRPLREPEARGFLPLFDLVAREGDAFDVAARLTLRAMVQSPQFLYHLEDRSAGEQVNARELASRLSYLVWASGPDQALRDAADAGQLDTPAGREAEVRRLAEDPRALTASLAFVEDWIALERLEQAVRGLDDDTKAAMRAETEAFTRDVLWGDAPGGLLDLVTADWTYLAPELADVYGLEAPDAMTPVDLSELPERRGLLTQPAVLASHANGNRPSIVSRGLFLLRALTCRDIPDPPVGVDTTTTALPETASERARSEERLDPGTGECGLCHRAFDPLAYAFEPFDGAGRYQSLDIHGNATREDGWIPNEDGEVLQGYANVDELIDGLAALPAVHQCLAEKPLVYALRRGLGADAADRCLVLQVEEAARRAGGSYVDLLVAIATHPSFTRLVAEEAAR